MSHMEKLRELKKNYASNVLKVEVLKASMKKGLGCSCSYFGNALIGLNKKKREEAKHE